LLLSPRLQQLHSALQDGDTAVLDSFWQAIALDGAPLVEPIADDPTHRLVTFLWQSDLAHEYVHVMGGPPGADFHTSQMTRLLTTNLWYKSLRVVSDAWFSYWLCPDVTYELYSEALARCDVPHAQIDPLNPYTYPPTAPYCAVVRLPDAPPIPKVGPPKGRVTAHQFHSELLGNERTVWVYTPPDYNIAGAPYDLLLHLDGEWFTERVPLPTILDDLITADQLHPLIGLFVANVPGQRNKELGWSSDFTAFLRQELLPWLRELYHVTLDPARSVIGGCSRGGLAAAYTGLNASDLFGNVLSQSGAFWYGPPNASECGWIMSAFAQAESLPLRFYLNVGCYETVPFPIPPNAPTMLLANRHMRDVLVAKGNPVTYREYPGGHDFFWWHHLMSEGLVALLGYT
jgi:enterochelin esterase-like enzyme